MLYTEEEFEEAVNNYSKDMEFTEVENFVEYWCAKNEGGRKMHWQKQKTFDIKRRMKQWQRNSKTWNTKSNGMPNTYNPIYEKNLQMDDVMRYHRHLISLGWEKLHGPGGTTWKKP